MYKKYKKEIKSIAKRNGVTEDIALDMFIANVKKGEAGRAHEYWYKGADELNYDELNREYGSFSEEKRTQARAEYLESFNEG